MRSIIRSIIRISAVLIAGFINPAISAVTAHDHAAVTQVSANTTATPDICDAVGVLCEIHRG